MGKEYPSVNFVQEEDIGIGIMQGVRRRNVSPVVAPVCSPKESIAINDISRHNGPAGGRID
jgi:hypothetical protein